MRCCGLADGADVIALAFHCEQHGAPDRARFNPLTPPFERSGRQCMFLEYEAHRVQIELRGEVKHREILVIKSLGCLRFLALPVGEVLVKLAMGWWSHCADHLKRTSGQFADTARTRLGIEPSRFDLLL
jgi:hypothetical protein